jgi:hypothetical protein
MNVGALAVADAGHAVQGEKVCTSNLYIEW